MTQLLSSSSRFDWKPCQKTRPWSLLCCKNRSRIHTGSQSCLYRGLLILANLHMSNTECWRLSEDWRRNHIQATSPEEPRLKITKWHYLKSPLNSIFNLKCCFSNDEMFCFLVLPWPESNVNMRPEQIAILSALSLLRFSYLNFQQQIQNGLILMHLYGLLRLQEIILRFAERSGRSGLWQRMVRAHPYYWTIPRPSPAESWFKIHFYDHTLPKDLFRKQLRICKNTDYPCWAHSCASIPLHKQAVDIFNEFLLLWPPRIFLIRCNFLKL